MEQQDPKKMSARDKGNQSISRVLRTLALQLAQEPVYRKDLSAACDNWVEPDSPEELFSRLFDPCLRSRETFYVVMDGVDQLEERSVRSLVEILNSMQTRSSPEQLSHLRILLSGRPQILKEFMRLSSETIDLASNNRMDLEKFINDRLGRMDILKGASEQVQRLRTEIFASLSDGANGDYVNVDLLLKEVAGKRWPAEIREVLSQKSQRSDTVSVPFLYDHLQSSKHSSAK